MSLTAPVHHCHLSINVTHLFFSITFESDGESEEWKLAIEEGIATSLSDDKVIGYFTLYHELNFSNARDSLTYQCHSCCTLCLRELNKCEPLSVPCHKHRMYESLSSHVRVGSCAILLQILWVIMWACKASLTAWPYCSYIAYYIMVPSLNWCLYLSDPLYLSDFKFPAHRDVWLTWRTHETF